MTNGGRKLGSTRPAWSNLRQERTAVTTDRKIRFWAEEISPGSSQRAPNGFSAAGIHVRI